MGLTRRYVIALVLASALGFSVASRAEERTLDRDEDPVVIECKDFAALFGTPMGRLALMALRGEAWAAIPFQIDQKKPDGEYAFTMGPDRSADPDPNLDANDELVFMAKDTGDSVGPETKWPPGAVKAVEVEVKDPKNNARGWAYLFSFSDKAPASNEDYIKMKIDEAKNYREVESYEYVMGGPINRTFPDVMRATKLPNGKPGLDVVDNLKVAGKITLIGGITIPLDFGEMTEAEIKGYIDGPVRILLLADAYLKFAGFVKVRTQGYQLISYYVNHAIWPISMDVPINDLGLVKNINILGYLDLNANVYGSYPFNAANPYDQQVVLDGTMTEAEKKLDKTTEIDWSAGVGPQGALIVRLFMVPEMPGLKQVTYYMDDKTAKNPYKDLPGLTGVGYELQGFTIDPDRPTATSYTYYYHLGQLKPEEVPSILDIVDHPVEVAVKPIRPVDMPGEP